MGWPPAGRVVSRLREIAISSDLAVISPDLAVISAVSAPSRAAASAP
eukprot:CAMPEP_0185450698 /NCGR_PEP_ID=MMETSP1365-20130426/63443_1 /TAXON_ID=38817 /ORGANISM="Gephyrocapsa oceanica, Strain RCC1303" /LENGTH=46 /DNA_ID= /DNA_START= /DNA_END= /DNA_ORIENTATION=